jgi:hypothetical protein
MKLGESPAVDMTRMGSIVARMFFWYLIFEEKLLSSCPQLEEGLTNNLQPANL